MGNLFIKDWGHAKDYVKVYDIKHHKPDDFVLATGKTYSVRKLLEEAFLVAGKTLKWKGTGVEEKGFIDNDRCVIRIDPRYFRPLEVDKLLGNPKKAKNELNWCTKITFKELISEMVSFELKRLK